MRIKCENGLPLYNYIRYRNKLSAFAAYTGVAFVAVGLPARISSSSRSATSETAGWYQRAGRSYGLLLHDITQPLDGSLPQRHTELSSISNRVHRRHDNRSYKV